MPVSKELSHLEHSAVRLTLTVPRDEVKLQYDQLIADYLKSAQLPGFRKGKVPRNILERKFGEGLKGEALNKIIGKALVGVFEDESVPREDKPLPYSEPRLDEEAGEIGFDLSRDLVFSVIYDVLPKVTVGPWKGLEVEVPDVIVDDGVMQSELDKIRERSAIVLDRNEDAAAAKDDVVTITYRELDGQNPVAGSERQDFVFTLGSGYNLYQFDDDIVGMKKDETKDITKTFPEDYQHKELAGKTVTIRVTLTALKEKKLPDLDDDLAQDIDEKYQTLDDLKNSIRTRLQKKLDRRLRDISVSKLLEKIMETTPVDLPESMIRLELDGRIRNLARSFNLNSAELEQNLAKSGGDPAGLRESWRGDAEKALKSRLIVETLLEEQNLGAADGEVDDEMEMIAEESGNTLDEVKAYYNDEDARNYLREEIKERKLFDIFLAENTIKKGKREAYMDLMAAKA
ncbi:MAG: trigger factor [Treponema sp.]|nr:trigger factor [Treponema sp.]